MGLKVLRSWRLKNLLTQFIYMEVINSFEQIDLSGSNILILCDIDDTLLYWDLPFEHFVEKASKLKGFFLNPEDIEQIAQEYYSNYRKKTPPKCTDSVGFEKISKHEIQFITARSAMYKHSTVDHFKSIGLDYSNYKVHYTWDLKMSKGRYIRKFINLEAYDQVIFIDDLDESIHTVRRNHPNIQCYKFVRQLNF